MTNLEEAIYRANFLPYSFFHPDDAINIVSGKTIQLKYIRRILYQSPI